MTLAAPTISNRGEFRADRVYMAALMWMSWGWSSGYGAQGGRMSELKVDPAEIHASGVEVGEIAARTRSAFADTDTAIASAQSGWVGRSAGALASLAADWRESTGLYTTSLVEHGEKFVEAAAKYVQSDESGAALVRKAAQDIGTR
jgi:uncharacterized protein YukE